MPNSYVIHLPHYLDEKGELAKMPDPAKRLAVYFGSIVAWVTRCPEPEDALTNVVCRRSRSRPPCYGEVYAHVTLEDEIMWRLPTYSGSGDLRATRAAACHWQWAASPMLGR